MMEANDHPVPEIAGYYNKGREQHRLSSTEGQLEYSRTQELLTRFLPPPPSVVLDIGGGAGIYSFWLASLGYSVHLVDGSSSGNTLRKEIGSVFRSFD